jgi:hypothetical protein
MPPKPERSVEQTEEMTTSSDRQNPREHGQSNKAHHSAQSQPAAKHQKTTPEAQPQRGREMATNLLRNG